LEIKSSLGARESYVEYCLEFHPHLGKIGRKKLTGYGYGWNFSEGKKNLWPSIIPKKCALIILDSQTMDFWLGNKKTR
jgi:hypothetical protein